MKKRFLTLFCLGLALPVCALANLASVLNPQPTKQVMHVAASAKPKAKIVVDSDDDAAQIKKVKAIMAKDKQIQHAKGIVLNHKSLQFDNNQDVNSSFTRTDSTPIGQAQADGQLLQQIKALKEQLSVVNQQMLMFQQQSDGKIEMLTTQLQNVQKRDGRLTQAMQLLNHEVIKLSNIQGSAQQAKMESTSTINHSEDQSSVYTVLSSHLFQYIYWAFALILLFLIYYYFQLSRKRKKLIAADPRDLDTEGEYDFLGSQEGIPAKLNLARSYLAMGDYDQMRQVLGEVMQEGDNDQKQQAQELLKKIV